MKSADLHRHFWRNRKARSLTDAEHRVYTSLLAYCADQENDGRVALDDIADVCAQQGHPGEERAIAQGLAAKRALDPEGDAWRVHDWLDHQPSVEELEARSEERRERMAELGRRGGSASTERKRAAAVAREAAKAGAQATTSGALVPDHKRSTSGAQADACAGTTSEHKRSTSPPALPCPARPGPSGAGGRAVGVDRTTPEAPTAPSSAAGSQGAPAPEGARPLPLTKTVARAELLDPSRMARVRDSGGDVQAEACRILDEHAHREREQERAAQEDHRKSLAETLRQNRDRIGLTPHAPSRLPPPIDDPDERKAIAGETFDLDAGDQPGENRA